MPTLIAHRGYSGRYPENTLIAYRAAYNCGARFVELDIQLTGDLTPILHHDLSLKRMADVDKPICEITDKQLKQYKASYPTVFGQQFADNSFTTLEQFCQWLKKYSDVTAFIEIKPESIGYFGLTAVADNICRSIKQTEAQSQHIIISSDTSIIESMRQRYGLQIGWVLDTLDSKAHECLNALQPDFAFCDIDFISSEAILWKGGWQWAVYNADDVNTAMAMVNRGITLIETNEIGTLIGDKRLASAL